MDTFGTLSLIVLGIGLVVLISGLRGRSLGRRTMATPTTRIAEAEGNGLVEISGTFRRGDGEAERFAPFTGKPALWWHVKIQISQSNGKGTTYATRYEETSREALWVEDGSAELACVETERGSRFEVRETMIYQPPADAQAFCALHDLPWNERYVYCVQTICEGEPAYALGLSRREAGKPRPDGYRDEPTSQLVLFGPDAKERPWARDEELLVANQKEADVVSSLRMATMGGSLLIALGLVGSGVWLYAHLLAG